MIRYTDINTGNDWLNQSLENYLIHGLWPGGFLTSVLANDLQLAVGRADHWNKERLPEIVDEVVFKMPAISIGSYEAVRDWCRDVDGRRSQYANEMSKRYVMRVLKDETVSRTEIIDPPF